MGSAAPLLMLAATALASCAGASLPGGVPAVPDACVVAAAPPEAGAARVVVGLQGVVDPAHAPVPRTEAERLLFAQLYDPLVRVTCEGRNAPVLAASWEERDDGRRWVFTLRSDVRDWEGDPITAAAVVSSWRAAQAARQRDGDAPGAKETLEAIAASRPLPRFTSLAVVDRYRLRVELAEPVPLAFFARPELAVRTSSASAGWPAGSGAYRPDADTGPGALGPERSRVAASPARTGGAGVEFRTVTDDPRNALDTGVDVLVTADPAVIDYATASAAFRTVPLDWDRSYPLLLRGARGESDDAGAAGAARVVRPPEAALAALARDAVPVRARPATVDESATCVRSPVRRSVRTGAPDPRIVYPAGDDVARALAERLVALVLDAPRPEARWLTELAPGVFEANARVRAAGLGPSAFRTALRAGGDAAYVFAVDRLPGPGHCEALDDGLDDALHDGLDDGLDDALGRTPPGDRDVARAGAPIVVPLIDTGRTLILRRGVGGLAVDGHGRLLLDALARDGS